MVCLDFMRKNSYDFICFRNKLCYESNFMNLKFCKEFYQTIVKKYSNSVGLFRLFGAERVRVLKKKK